MNLYDSLRRLLTLYPIASAIQLGVLLNTSLQVARRMIRVGVRRGHLKVHAGFNARGRPVLLVSLRSRRDRPTVHDWEVTEFVACLVRTLRGQADLTVNPVNVSQGIAGVLPDFGFLLASNSLNKSLLHFLEIDRATEPIERRSSGTDIASKLHRYMQLRASNGYRAICSSVASSVRGFRVLVVTPNPARSSAILRQAPGDFVWVVDWETLLKTGVHGNVWLSVGNPTPRSIFGSLVSRIETATRRHPTKANEKASRHYSRAA